MTIDRKYILKSPLRAALLARLIAKGIDLFLILILSFVYYPFGIFLSLIYIAVCDSIQNGQSVGKKMMGFQVISLEDGTPCSFKQSFIRNLPIFIPVLFTIIPLWGWIFCAVLAVPLFALEIYLLVKLESGHRLGDVMADTTVLGNDQQRADIRKAKQSWFDQNPVAM